MRDTDDTVKIRHVRIDWSMFDVKRPRSIETGDIKFMIYAGVFANTYVNLIRIDTLATRGQLLAKARAEQYYLDYTKQQKEVISIAERIR
jgi:hypothetical protein